MSETTEAIFFKLLRFGVVGLSGMVIDFSITWLVKERLRWNKYLANTFGFSLAVIAVVFIGRRMPVRRAEVAA